MLRLLTLLTLASAQLKIRYDFNTIYDTKVIDLSGNGYHFAVSSSSTSAQRLSPI
jgi:hypothetical protein